MRQVKKFDRLRYPYVCPVCLGKTGEVRLGNQTYVIVFHRMECPVGIRMRPVRVVMPSEPSPVEAVRVAL